MIKGLVYSPVLRWQRAEKGLPRLFAPRGAKIDGVGWSKPASLELNICSACRIGVSPLSDKDFWFD